MTARTSEVIERQVADILRGFSRYGTAAARLLEQFSGDEVALAHAADRYVSRWVGERRSFRWTPNDPKELAAVRQLLPALAPEAAPRFTPIVRAAAEAKSVAPSGVSTLLMLADLRHEPERWQERLVAAALAENSEETVAGIHQVLQKHEPLLAYAVFDALSASSNAATNAARLYAITLAVSRLGELVTFTQDGTHLAQLTTEHLLDDLGPVHRAARAVLRAHPAAARHLLEGIGPLRNLQPKQYVLALQLLAAAGERDQVADALCDLVGGPRTGYVEMVVSEMHRTGTGLFLGWGKHPGPVRIAKIMLQRRRWEDRFWATVFAETLKALVEPQHEPANRLRRCLVDALLLIADDPKIEMGDRRLALDAIGRSGHGRIASRLGRIAEASLGDAVRQARRALSATEKGRPIEPATGVRIALDTYRASGEHWR